MTGIEDPEADIAFEMKAYGPIPGDFRIGLAPIPLQRWLEGSIADPAPRKEALLAKSPEDVWGAAAGSEPAQFEALSMIVDWLGVRAPPLDGRPPLRVAAGLVEDDLCLMEKRDGKWALTAASLCSASFFTPADAVGKALHQLHDPVPGFNERFLVRVARIFDNLTPNTVLERRNWSIVNSGELSLPRAEPVRNRITEIAQGDAKSALYVRSERQTIRRLSQSGGALFTIRIWRESLGTILDNPLRRSAFKAAWTSAMTHQGAQARSYKSFPAYDRLISPLLASKD